MATLRELQETYSYADVLELVDIIQTDRDNEEIAYKELEKKRQ